MGRPLLVAQVAAAEVAAAAADSPPLPFADCVAVVIDAAEAFASCTDWAPAV